jgi:hypothetical protein
VLRNEHRDHHSDRRCHEEEQSQGKLKRRSADSIVVRGLGHARIITDAISSRTRSCGSPLLSYSADVRCAREIAMPAERCPGSFADGGVKQF